MKRPAVVESEALDSQLREADQSKCSWKDYFEEGSINADEMELLNKLNATNVDSGFTETELFSYLKVLPKIPPGLPIIKIFSQLRKRCRSQFLTESETEKIPHDAFAAITSLVLSPDDVVSCHSIRMLVELPWQNGDTDHLILDWIKNSFEKFVSHETRILISLEICKIIVFRVTISAIQETHSSILDNLCQNFVKSRTLSIQYGAIFVLWLLSFRKNDAKLIQERYNIVVSISDVAKTAQKEKLWRLAISLLRNYIKNFPGDTSQLLVGSKFIDYVESYHYERITDEEAKVDFVYLRDVLRETYQKLNSFDEYSAEVRSGKLEWSPPHKSPLFWSDNVMKLDESNYFLLRLLKQIIEVSSDPRLVCIAANDIGFYVQHHPDGHTIIERLGLKQLVMNLLTSEDQEVRFHALTAMQKYMKNLMNS